MNYKRVYLSGTEFREGLLKTVTELDVIGTPSFSSVKMKEEKTEFLIRLVRGSLVGRYRHEEGFHGEDSFTSRYLTKGVGSELQDDPRTSLQIHLRKLRILQGCSPYKEVQTPFVGQNKGPEVCQIVRRNGSNCGREWISHFSTEVDSERDPM